MSLAPAVSVAAPAHPGRDLAAVENYAYQLLCDAATPDRSHSVPRLRASALNPERLNRAHDSPARQIPLAYHLWLDYLFELDAQLHYLHLGPRALSALELQGLQALARARARFLRRHSFCPHCEAANLRSAQRCARCHKELS